MRLLIDRDRLAFLFDEDAAGGSGTAGAASVEAQAQAQATTPEAFLARLRELEAENARYRADQAAAAQRTREEEEAKLLKAGQADELLKKLRDKEAELTQRHAEFVERTRKAELTSQLSAAIAGHGKLVPHAGEQLMRLFAADFEAVEGADGRTIVRSKDEYLSPAAYIAARLADPKYAHFLAAEHRGGAGQTGAAPVPGAAQGQGQAQSSTGQPMADLMFASLAARRESANVPRWLRRGGN